jgi:type III pantothenate kinase
MTLCIDIGNTDTVFAFIENHKIIETYRAKTTDAHDHTQWRVLLQDYKSKTPIVVISSVVKDMASKYQNTLSKAHGLKVLLINPAKQKLLSIKTENPEELGSDLFCNALQASLEFTGQQVLAIDMGTALTFTLISAHKELIGVNIFPGIKTAIKSLFQNTSLLPEIKFEIPNKILGTNTIEAIQAGLMYGYQGIIQNHIDLIRRGFGQETKIIITGGLSVYATQMGLKADLIDQNHTLKGIYSYGEMALSQNYI